MTLTTPDGTDPTKAIEDAVRDQGKQVAFDAMDVWFTASQERVSEAASQRAGGGAADDSEGMESRKHNELSGILDEFQPPEWDDDDEVVRFSVTHAAAVFHEFGADAHEIQAAQAQALAFEWPDAPPEKVEEFEDTFPTVFFDNVDHPGTPAIGFLRHGREEARKRLVNAGYEVSTFGGDNG